MKCPTCGIKVKVTKNGDFKDFEPVVEIDERSLWKTLVKLYCEEIEPKQAYDNIKELLK